MLGFVDDSVVSVLLSSLLTMTAFSSVSVFAMLLSAFLLLLRSDLV